MPTHIHPVLVWNDTADHVTAALVGDLDHAAAHAPSEAEALRQLRSLLNWRAEHEWWNAVADFHEPRLSYVKMETRLQYEQDQRILPCPETVRLKIPCVTGKQENGILVASIPHLGLLFDYQEPESLKGLISHFVKEYLHQLSPLELAPLLPPADCRLTELPVRLHPRHGALPPPELRAELKPLFAVAEPLGRDFGRQRAATAAFGRETLLQQLQRLLSQEKANLLLVGEHGVGKSTLLLDAVKRLLRQKNSGEDGKDDKDLRAYRYWRGSANRMIAGMQYLGEWEKRCEEFIHRLVSMDGIYCVENLLELVQAGGSGPGDSVGAFLLPYLQRGELRVIAEATPSELSACRRLLPSLLDAFRVVIVPPFAPSEAVTLLNHVAKAVAASGRVEVENGVPLLVHHLFSRFQPYTVFPGPAVNFLRGLCQALRPRQSLTKSEVLRAFGKLTGLREIFLRDDLSLDVEEVERHFASVVIGQSDATRAAAQVVTSIKAGMTDPCRPFGVMLFCGPTGVGKTALVKELADYCFGQRDQSSSMVRLDMSEFHGLGAARRFLENPQGGPAPWIERVRQQPFSVVLFDEIEKASPEVFDTLLGLLDEGRLSDRFGRVTQFRSAVVIMTSNLGSAVTGAMGFSSRTVRDYAGAVANFFRPEFFNRLDAVVAFAPLAPEQVRQIAVKELQDLGRREGFQAAGIRLDWSDEVITAVAQAGYDHQFGARPMQRAMERLVTVPLARWKVAHPQMRNLTLHLRWGAEGLNVQESP